MRPAALALALLFGSCREGSNDSRLTNLGLATAAIVGQEELYALDVPEAGQKGLDLNGDGDALDRVLHVHDFATGTLASLALAFEPGTVSVGGVLIAFAVPEEDEGGTDLNGDGDALDLVLHVHSVATGVTTNTGLATRVAPAALGIASVAFVVDEFAQGGTDLNGDGDAADFALHVYDARTLVTTNALRAATSNTLFHDHAFAFTTDEPSAASDLNGDGDVADLAVLELFDLLLGGIEQTPLAIRDTPFAVGVDDWVVLVDEVAQELDLNGDGDELDGVWHELDPHGGPVTPLGFSSAGQHATIDDDSVLALAVQEIDGLDANGDGDELDTLVVLHDPAHAQTFAAGLAVDPLRDFALAGERLAFLVDEGAEDEDRNGDLDLADDVLHLMDVTNGTVTNHGTAVAALAAVEQVLLLWLDESEDGLDRNGDGDALDLVLTKLHPEFLFEENLALACLPRVLAQDGTMALVAVSEADQDQDLNGDGDRLDDVAWRIEPVFPIDFPETLATNLGVAIDPSSAAILADGRGLLLVLESDEGVDLNGDGDLFDAVLHRFE